MKKVPLLFLIVFGGYIPRPLGRKKGMYPPKITLPKQHTPPFMAGLLIILVSVVAFLLSCANDSGAEGSADGLVIPFVIENGDMIMEATINGKYGRFVLDTGMTSSVVPEAHISFTLLPSIVFMDGRLRIQPKYMVKSVEFANGSVRASSWLVRNAGALGNIGIPHGTEGFLGNGIFAGYWVEISFSRNEIVLHKGFPERFAQARHSPLTVMYRNQLVLTIDVDGREVLTFVDTGLPDAVFFPDTFAEGMDRTDLRLIASNGEIGGFHLMQTKSLKIMDMTYSDKLILGNSYIGARDAFKEDAGIGLIGIGFLRHYDLLLDYRSILPYTTNDDSAGMFYIPIVAPEERDYGFYSFLDMAPEFGIMRAVRWNRASIRVNDLLEDSEAYALGLRPDSVITQLDGESARSFSQDEIANPYFYDRFTEFTALIDGVEVTLRRER